MFVDASSTGIGFTLAQVQNAKEAVIAYNGRGLNQAERNYSTTEREALALVEGIKKFQPYLQNRKFTVVTDHSSLRWLMNVKDASGRLARWALLLQQYDFEIVHRPGKIHGNAVVYLGVLICHAISIHSKRRIHKWRKLESCKGVILT